MNLAGNDPGIQLDISSNAWARFAEARTVRAGGADPLRKLMPLHFHNRFSTGHADFC
jgi:hypothetical protein